MALGRAMAPTLHAHEGHEHLLVWAEQGQWLLVDDACATLLGEVAPGRTLEEARERAVAAGVGPRVQVEGTVTTVWGVLAERGLLAGAEPPSPRRSTPARICNVTMNLTNRCNLHCAWCYNGRRQTREASVTAVLAALRRGRASLSETASLIVLGGEPWLRFPALLELLDHAADLCSPPVLVSSNGTLIRPEQARALAKRRVEVQVSLDGPDREQHDAIRGRGSFEATQRGVGYLVAAGVPTILSMVYTAHSWNQFEPYLDMARQLGVREARFIPLRTIGQASGRHADLPNQVVAFEHLLGVLDRRPEVRSLLGRDYFSILVKQCARSSTRASCGVGEQVLFIDADGSLYPCPNHVSSAWRLGSILDCDLPRLWESSSRLRALREQSRVERCGACAECVFRRWCAGDCRGEATAGGRGPPAPSPHCTELKQVYLRALWLAARHDPRLPGTQSALRAC